MEQLLSILLFGIGLYIVIPALGWITTLGIFFLFWGNNVGLIFTIEKKIRRKIFLYTGK